MTVAADNVWMKRRTSAADRARGTGERRKKSSKKGGKERSEMTAGSGRGGGGGGGGGGCPPWLMRNWAGHCEGTVPWEMTAGY